VILRPVRVQGEGAAGEIARAIGDLNEYGSIDVLIVGRGGGSIEDLWAYNEEVVARAIYNSTIPVISAVGHEIDFTIADLVADLRAPTPSAAAELVVRDQATLLEHVHKYWYTMHESVHTMLDQHKDTIRHFLASHSFHRPIDLLRQASQRIDELERGLTTSLHHRFAILKSVSQSFHHRLLALDPQQTLKRGYAIVSRNGKLITSSKVPSRDDILEIAFHDGVVRSTVS
jgi:exodeoxyribonuclease VII large subunit